MQSLWSRAAEAPFRFSRVRTHVLQIAIARAASRGLHDKNTTAFYTTETGFNAELNALHSDDIGHSKVVDVQETGDRRPQKKPDLLISRQYVEHRKMRPRAPMSAIEALNSICDTEEALERYVPTRRNFNKFLGSLHRLYDPEEKVGSGYVDYLGSNLAAVQLVADQAQRQDDGMDGREPATSVQFEKYHAMINKMVDRLISESYYVEFPKDPERARRNLESLDSAWTAIRMLRSEGYPKYKHPSIDPQATKQARDQLADKIRALFEAWGVDRAAKPKFQVAKICYNLLVCPVPPTIHHYNLLLVGFLRKAHYSLGDIVINSFFEDSRLRPTPETLVCLLVHYRKKGDIKGFYHIIRRMMALDNRGMLIRRRWYEDVVKIPALRQWARHPEVTTSLQANWVIERPSRGQDVYEALVSGLLGFGRVKDAVKVFIGSLQERMGISVDLFIYMLRQCLYTVDASTADMLSRGLIDNVDVVVSLLLRDNCPQRLVEHLYPVLNMGEPPSWPLSEERVKMFWNSSTLATDHQDSDRARRIQTAMFIRHTETYLTRLEKRVRLVNQLNLAMSPVERFVIANHCTSKLYRLKERQGKLSGTLLKHQTLQRIVRMLEKLTWDLGSPERLVRSHKRAARLVGDNLPRPAEADWFEQRARFEEIMTVTDDWFHYRVSKTRGIIGEHRRLMLYAELKMITARRLILTAFSLLRVPAELGWRSLDISEPITQFTNGLEPQGEADGKEVPTAEGGLWPRAETDAVFVGVPTVSGGRAAS
ncbi:hypothetical protein N0V82_005900 [Gnomoniopsis sp. IMI 355080]|nr:hypothetical protein N0V82_005900 [Gnomoniopsis sp. IMI 355080]